jgi:hypothetical protein
VIAKDPTNPPKNARSTLDSTMLIYRRRYPNPRFAVSGFRRSLSNKFNATAPINSLIGGSDSQPSLRDCSWFHPYPGLTSWATLSRPFGTVSVFILTQD